MDCPFGSDTGWKLLTALISFGTLVVAINQHEINRNKLKLDLFDRRFKVVEALRKFLSRATGNGKIDESDLNEYRMALFEAPFLFEQEMADYLYNVWERGINVKALTMAPKGQGDGEKWAQHMRDFSGDLKSISDRFAPYMAFGK